MKQIVWLLTMVLLCPLGAAAHRQYVHVSTQRVSLVFGVGDNGRLYQCYLGARLSQERDFEHLPGGIEAFLTHGMEDYFEPALHIEHADGIFRRHIDLDFICCVLIIFVLVEIDHALLDFVFVFAIQIRSIGDEAVESDSAFEVAEVHTRFLRNDIQAVAGDDHAVTNSHQDFIIGINQSKRRAYAYLGTFGYTDTAGTYSQLRLVIALDRDACAFDRNRLVPSAVYCDRCLSVVYNYYNAACDRNIAVAAAYCSGHGLCSQETFVFVVHVLRCRCDEVDVAFLLTCRCFQVTENIDSALVAIDAYRDARRDGIRFLSQAHCQASALGQEVAFVGSSCLDGARDDIAADLHIGLVPCDVQADRCSYLVFLAVSFIVAALCVLVSCSITFADSFVCLVADTRFTVFSLRSRRLHTHALHDIGGKARILDQLLPMFPEHINTFVDLFCGGCNVGINTKANNYVYNDSNRELIGLLKMFLRLNTSTILKRMDEIVEHYGFSKTKDHNFAYYGGNPMKGVSRYNKDPFLRLRQDYNNSPRNNQHYVMLYALVVFGFNNQMRFNDKGEYNLPVGKRDFNEVIRRKLEVFVDKLKAQQPVIQNKDFRRFDINQLDNQSIVYLDPPYLISTATYNEGGGWTEKDELDLLDFMDNLNARGIRFALSNMLEHKGRKNQLLIDWIGQRDLQVVDIIMDYSNSNYHVEGKTSGTVEVLVKNY